MKKQLFTCVSFNLKTAFICQFDRLVLGILTVGQDCFSTGAAL